MWFDDDKQYGENMERNAFDDLGRLMVWLCLAGFWIAVAWWVLA